MAYDPSSAHSIAPHITQAHGPSAPALKRLAHLSALSAGALALLRSTAKPPVRHRRGSDLNAQSDGLRFIVSGWAALAAKAEPAGPIYSILLPGDPVDLSLLAPRRCGIYALTRIETIDFGDVAPLLTLSEPGAAPLAGAFKATRDAAEDRLVAHMSRLCGLSAYDALVDFFNDIRDRLQVVDLVASDGFQMPLGQARIGSALGLTTSHVNRTLQQLKRDGVLELAGERLRLSSARPSPA